MRILGCGLLYQPLISALRTGSVGISSSDVSKHIERAPPNYLFSRTFMGRKKWGTIEIRERLEEMKSRQEGFSLMAKGMIKFRL